MLSEIATVVAGRNVCRCSKRDFVGYRQTTTSSGVRYYLSSDHLGSTATIVESTDLAHPVDQYYYPYGQPRGGWAINTDRAYTGQTTDDAETGLYDYNARYYHPTLHRFISADTVVPDPANPQALNRYSYVANNPATYTDPTGDTAKKRYRDATQAAHRAPAQAAPVSPLERDGAGRWGTDPTRAETERAFTLGACGSSGDVQC